MIKGLCAAVAALALTAGPVSAAAQTAGPAPAASSSRDQAAVTLGRVLFEAIDFMSILRRTIPEAMRANAATAKGPQAQWAPRMEQAVLEEIESDPARLHALFGRLMTAEMTEAEIKAGITVLGSPAARAAMAARGSGRPVAPPPPAELRELQRVMQSPAGLGFKRKLDALDASSPAAQQAMMTALMPGAMRRFAEKLEKSGKPAAR